MDEKRLFLGIRAEAPWEKEMPEGRILAEDVRHMTLAFLGNVDFERLEAILPEMPVPDFKVGLTGRFDRLLFLPKRHPRVVAYHVDWLNGDTNAEEYYQVIVDWLNQSGFPINTHEDGFLSHVTVARKPFKISEWKKYFTPLPVAFSEIHLYESLGNLTYQSLFRRDVKQPIEEIEHTADLAFRIRGESLEQLHKNAQVALAFHFPPLLDAFSNNPKLESIDDVIIDLNEVVSKVDQEIGTPLKAVSFHGDVVEEEGCYFWEMIVDV